MKTDSICTGCGENVSPGTGCCTACKGDAILPPQIYVKPKTPALTFELKDRIKDMYFKADLRPMQIYKITRVRPDDIRKIVYGAKA